MAKWKPALTNPTLLSEVIQKIDDDAPRLAYADWLESEGAPECADFIRVECAFAKASPADDDYPDLIERKREVIARMWNRGTHRLHENEDTESYSFHGNWHDDGDGIGHLRRGFQFCAGEPSDEHRADEAAAAVRFRDALDELIKTTTVRALLFYGSFSRQLDTILATPAAANLTALYAYNEIDDSDRSVDAVHAILSSPIASRLEWLHLDFLTAQQISQLGKTDKLTRMRRLELQYPEDEPAAIGKMVSAAWFQGLRDVWIGLGKSSSASVLSALSKLEHLDAVNLYLHDSGVLNASSQLRFEHLGRLRFPKSSLTSDDMKTLGTWSLPKLRVLAAYGCGLKHTEIRHLTKAEWARQLRVLTLGGNRLDDKSVSILANSGILRGMRILNLSWNIMSAAGLMPLAAEGVMPALTTLELHAPEEDKLSGTEAEMEEFLRTLTLPKLRHLDLGYWPLGDRGAIALAANPSLSNLRSLSLGYCKIGPKGAAAICESPHFSNLLDLRLDYNNIGDGLGPLRDRAVLPHLSWIDSSMISNPSETLTTAFWQMRKLLEVARPEVCGFG